MIIAIVARNENILKEKSFSRRYYISNYFKEIFDNLNILLFPVISEKNIEKICDICDGLLITGSCNDINPKYYGEKAIKETNIDIDEYSLDSKLINAFSNKDKPILGICGGLQSINVFYGGTLYQNIENHQLKKEMHKIKVEKNSFLYNIYNKSELFVNSLHHQAIKKVAPGFNISAISEDGIVEAIEKNNIVGVQWHPEKMQDIEFFNTYIKKYLYKESI